MNLVFLLDAKLRVKFSLLATDSFIFNMYLLYDLDCTYSSTNVYTNIYHKVRYYDVNAFKHRYM